MGNNRPGLPLSCIITTSLKPDLKGQRVAAQLGEKLGVPVVKRGRQSLNNLFSRYGVEGIIVVSQQKVSYHHLDGEFFFHPDKSSLRIKEIKAGKTDQMIKAMDLKLGYSILDCTLGLATDAIVASYVAGSSGQVLGIESSPIIAALVEMGLKEYDCGKREVIEAMRRVRVLCAEHGKYLAHLAPDSFDVVYFDPMFRKPKYNARCPIDPLRPLAEHSPLRTETVQRALQVARRRVVIKERRKSNEFDRLGVDMVVGGKYSHVQYGVWILEGGGH